MTSASGNSQYDLVIYGATGFTGQYVVEEVARVAEAGLKANKSSIKWAVAGRNKDKLLKSIDTARLETGINLEDVGVIVADVQDESSLSTMAEQAKVVINCVGPYIKYGEPVVKACIENGANHVDISGEPQFLEGMQLKYDGEAEEAGVHIVGACGYDSIPAEMGVNMLLKHFPGELHSVDTYLETKSGGAKVSINTGTMESAVYAINNRAAAAEIRNKLFPTRMTKQKYEKQMRRIVHKNSQVGLWGIPLPTDEPMVYRTQRYRHDVLGLRPIQYSGHLGVPSPYVAAMMLMGMVYFYLIASFSWTRKLLIKYPKMMTAGVFSRGETDRESLKKIRFTSHLHGKGWSRKLAENEDEFPNPPDKEMIVKVSGPDPGYGATSLMLVASAMTILQEKDLCLRKGGVMTPGVAFMNTGYIDRIVSRGMKITVDEL